MQKSLFENTTFDLPQKPALRICDVVCSCGFSDESPKALFFIEYTALAERSAQRLLKKWVDSELIVSEGAGRSTRYRLNE